MKAVIVLEAGAQLSAIDALQHCARYLARYLVRFTVPAVVEFVAELPHSLIGKLARREIREGS